MKPLTMFVAASATATVTSVRMKSFFGHTMTMRAATMETEDIAFVSDIKGVWRRRETCLMSSVPRKVAIRKIRRFTTTSAWETSTTSVSPALVQASLGGA